MSALPVVDLSDRDDEVAAGIGCACREHGFFYLVGHGIDEALGQRLEALSHRFFALPEDVGIDRQVVVGQCCSGFRCQMQDRQGDQQLSLLAQARDG